MNWQLILALSILALCVLVRIYSVWEFCRKKPNTDKLNAIADLSKVAKGYEKMKRLEQKG
jgi:hypothetical protein